MVSCKLIYSHSVFFFDPLATGPGLGIDDVEDLEETLYGVLNVMESLSSVLFPG